MTKPDHGAPDSGANHDDAVWLDLVARLEGRDPHGDPADSTEESGTVRIGSGADDGADGSEDVVPASRTFRDFDPLGLSVPAPVEPSAKDRLSSAAEADESGGAAERGTSPGPRDYVADDEDDGDFVPDVPPSLAGADPMMVLAWFGAVGGPVTLVLFAMFWRSAPIVAVLGVVAAFAVSVVFLIMKLPGEKDDHDDGARV